MSPVAGYDPPGRRYPEDAGPVHHYPGSRVWFADLCDCRKTESETGPPVPILLLWRTRFQSRDPSAYIRTLLGPSALLARPARTRHIRPTRNHRDRGAV